MKSEDEVRYELDLLFEAYYECKRHIKDKNTTKSSRKTYETLASIFRWRINEVQFILEDEVTVPIPKEPEWFSLQCSMDLVEY